MKLKCIKGIATNEFVVCLQGDIVELYSIDENEITANGIFGWCMGHEICFTAKEFASSFCVWVPTATVG
jgi:hypothetical protein